MRYIKPEKLTPLEQLLIAALQNSCPPLCSHEGCSAKRMNSNSYYRGSDMANKYRGSNANTN